MRILKVPRQLGPIANASIFVACFPLQPYPPCLSNLGEELVYLDEKKAGWKDDCLFIFGSLQKKKKKKCSTRRANNKSFYHDFLPEQRVALV